MGCISSRTFNVKVAGFVVSVEKAPPEMQLANCDILCGVVTRPTSHTKGGQEQSKKVALKRLRVTRDPNPLQRAHLQREADQWRQLKHPYILEFLGAGQDKDGNLYLASPWMDNRTLSEFIAQEPDCDRPKFLFEICAAVVYLHDVCEVIHGDIRAENILVSPERHALLCDFGLTRPKAIEGPDLAGAGTRNWQSPELFDGQESSTSSDVLSGKVPFAEYEHPALLNAVLIKDERPNMEPKASPNGTSYNYLWKAAEQCWAKYAINRPPISEVYSWLDKGYALNTKENAL